MFIKLFGSTTQEQLMATAAFVVVFSLILIGVLLIVSPIVGNRTTESTISTEIVKVLASLITGAFGFMLGSGMNKGKDSCND